MSSLHLKKPKKAKVKADQSITISISRERSRSEEVKNAFQDRNSDGQPVSSEQPKGALDPTEGTLEAGHVSEVKVAVELYM